MKTALLLLLLLATAQAVNVGIAGQPWRCITDSECEAIDGQPIDLAPE